MVFITKEKIEKKKKVELQNPLAVCSVPCHENRYLQKTANDFDGNIAYLLF